MLETLNRIWKAKDLRRKVLFVIGMLVLFRIVAHVPVPGVDVEKLRLLFQSNQILGLLNIFSGGTMQNFSIVALGVGPYITASIIFQLLGMIFPKIDEIQKEGEAGRQRINHWTRLLTVPLAFLQAWSLIVMLDQSSGAFAGAGKLIDLSPSSLVLTMLTMTAGTVFLMWIGELISERKVGNGISLIIFAGIIAGMPSMIQRAIVSFDSTQIFTLLLYVVVALLTIVGVVIVNEAQRNIPIAYARQTRGMQVLPGVKNHLPLRINMAGVIPIIFAISIMLIPPMVARFFLSAKTEWLAYGARMVVRFFDDQLIYASLYFLLVFVFTYFYTSIIFQPDKIAENLQKQGAFVPGIRPGKPTAEYISKVTSRILLAGGLFLAVIAVLPLALVTVTSSSILVVGGTSLLIVVSVVIETIKQIEGQLATMEYDYYN